MVDGETIKWDSQEWDPAERAIEAWLRSVLAGAGVDVIWRDRPRERNVQVPYIEIALGVEVAVGHDDVECTEDVEHDRLAVTITGTREIMLSIQLRTRDQRTYGMARRYMGKLRQSLHHPAYVQLLSDAGLGVVECEPLRTIPQSVEGRVESLVLLEVKFCTVHEYVDPNADEQLGVVDTIAVGISIDGEDPPDVIEVDVRSPA